jgi:hypothetical protein
MKTRPGLNPRGGPGFRVPCESWALFHVGDANRSGIFALEMEVLHLFCYGTPGGPTSSTYGQPAAQPGHAWLLSSAFAGSLRRSLAPVRPGAARPARVSDGALRVPCPSPLGRVFFRVTLNPGSRLRR